MKILIISLAALLAPLLNAQTTPPPDQSPAWKPTPEQVQQAYSSAAHNEAAQLADAQVTIIVLQQRIAELEKQLTAVKAPPSAPVPAQGTEPKK